MKEIAVLVCGASLFLGLVSGCGKSSESPNRRATYEPAKEPQKKSEEASGQELAYSARSESVASKYKNTDSNPAATPPGSGALQPADKQPTADRKIVFTAEVRVKVADMDKAETQLHALVSQHKGYIAHASVGTNIGAPQQSQWKVRTWYLQTAKRNRAAAGSAVHHDVGTDV